MFYRREMLGRAFANIVRSMFSTEFLLNYRFDMRLRRFNVSLYAMSVSLAHVKLASSNLSISQLGIGENRKRVSPVLS